MKKISTIFLSILLTTAILFSSFASEKIVEDKELEISDYKQITATIRRKEKMKKALNTLGTTFSDVIEDNVISVVEQYASLNIKSKAYVKEAKIMAATYTAETVFKYNLSIDYARNISKTASIICTYLFKAIEEEKISIGVGEGAAKYLIDSAIGLNPQINNPNLQTCFLDEKIIKKVLIAVEEITGPIADEYFDKKKAVKQKDYVSKRENGIWRIVDKEGKPYHGFKNFEKDGFVYTYYIMPDGRVQTGFVEDALGNLYYFNESGVMQKKDAIYSGELIRIDEKGQVQGDKESYFKAIWYFNTRTILDAYVINELKNTEWHSII